MDEREVYTQRVERLTFQVMVQHQVPWMGGRWIHRGWRDLPSRLRNHHQVPWMGDEHTKGRETYLPGDGPPSGPMDGREVDTQRVERLTFQVIVHHQAPWMGERWTHKG